MSFVKFVCLRSQSKPQPVHLPFLPLRKSEALARCIACRQPSMPPQSFIRALMDWRLAGVIFCACFQQVPSAASLNIAIASETGLG